MKKVKLIEVYNCISTFNSLLETQMPVKTSTKILTLVQEINNHLKDAEKQRTELIDKYGKKAKTGESVVPESKKQAFLDDLNNNVMNKEVEIFSELLSINDFSENFSITPSQLSLIKFLIKD